VRNTSAKVKPRRQLSPKAKQTTEGTGYFPGPFSFLGLRRACGAGRHILARNACKSGLPKSTIIANGLDSGDLGNDPCGKHSLQVAAALLGNIW
jgi:hypothetical protein